MKTRVIVIDRNHGLCGQEGYIEQIVAVEVSFGRKYEAIVSIGRSFYPIDINKLELAIEVTQ